MPNPIALSDVQVRRLVSAQEAIQAATVEAQRAHAALVNTRAHMDSLLEVIFDAHGVPATATVDLQNGVIVLTEDYEDAGTLVTDTP